MINTNFPLTNFYLMLEFKPNSFISMNKFTWRYPMNIQLESIGLPTIAKLIGKTSQIEMADGTVADLVSHLVGRFGKPAGRILLDSKGQLDLSIQVMVNNESFLPRAEYSRRLLEDGDKVKLMLLVGGG